MRVGVLALQGNFARHQQRLQELGAEALQVRTTQELAKVQGIILPGGESTTLLRLLQQELKELLCKEIISGLPALATCAGIILLARAVSHPVQECLQLLEVEVQRNAYGRQVDSFIDPTLSWTAAGSKELEQAKITGDTSTLEGVFIRAPKITKVGSQCSVLVQRGTEPVMVKQGNILGATFHPELSPGDKAVHQLFLAGL